MKKKLKKPTKRQFESFFNLTEDYLLECDENSCYDTSKDKKVLTWLQEKYLK